MSVAWLLYPLSPGAEIESIQVSSDMDPNSAVIEFRVAGAGHDDLITIEPLAASADHAGRERASAIQIRRNNQEYWSSGQVETAD